MNFSSDFDQYVNILVFTTFIRTEQNVIVTGGYSVVNRWPWNTDYRYQTGQEMSSVVTLMTKRIYYFPRNINKTFGNPVGYGCGIITMLSIH